jgi:hypothetical protein
LEGFGAQKREGGNLRVYHHPKQGATQPIGGVLKSIDEVFLSLVLACLLVAFGGLDLFSDNLWDEFIFVLLIIVSAGNPF